MANKNGKANIAGLKTNYNKMNQPFVSNKPFEYYVADDPHLIVESIGDGNRFYLSPNVVFCPHHILGKNDLNVLPLIFDNKRADCVAYRVDHSIPSLLPLTSFVSTNRPMQNNPEIVFRVVNEEHVDITSDITRVEGTSPQYKGKDKSKADIKIESANVPLLYDISLSKTFQRGESGSVFFGKADVEGTVKFSPLLMVLARNRLNRKRGRAIYIPSIAYGGLSPDYNGWVIEELGRFVQTKILNESSEWELIKDYQLPLDLRKLIKNVSDSTEWKVSPNSYEKEILKKLNDQQGDHFNHFIYKAIKAAEPVGTGSDTCCWIIDIERRNSAGSEYLFRIIGNILTAIETKDLKNYREINDKVEVYSESSKPITITKAVFDIWRGEKYSTVTQTADSFEATKKSSPICHHPLLCENEKLNKKFVQGVRRKKTKKDKNKNVQDYTGARYISHSCFRPSHLIQMPEAFNALCTVLNQLNDDTKNLLIEWK